MRPGSRFLRKRRDWRNGSGPERQRRTFGNADDAGRSGALRKKREAEAQAETDPTFLLASSGTGAFGRRNREREPAKFASSAPDRNPAEFAPTVTGKSRQRASARCPVSRETIRACSGGDPERVPLKFASMDRPGNLEGASASEGNPKGNRPRPQGLGRNPIPGTAERFGGPYDRGQWGPAAMPAPIRVWGMPPRTRARLRAIRSVNRRAHRQPSSSYREREVSVLLSGWPNGAARPSSRLPPMHWQERPDSSGSPLIGFVWLVALYHSPNLA